MGVTVILPMLQTLVVESAKRALLQLLDSEAEPWRVRCGTNGEVQSAVLYDMLIEAVTEAKVFRVSEVVRVVPVVYALYVPSQLGIYIGQTMNILQRLCDHHVVSDPTEAFVMIAEVVVTGSIDERERAWIKAVTRYAGEFNLQSLNRVSTKVLSDDEGESWRARVECLARAFHQSVCPARGAL